jgi:hypothetical protein
MKNSVRKCSWNYILKAEDKGEIVFSGNFLVIGRTGGDDD